MFPSGMVETPRFQAKHVLAKWERSEHEHWKAAGKQFSLPFLPGETAPPVAVRVREKK